MKRKYTATGHKIICSSVIIKKKKQIYDNRVLGTPFKENITEENRAKLTIQG